MIGKDWDEETTLWSSQVVKTAPFHFVENGKFMFALSSGDLIENLDCGKGVSLSPGRVLEVTHRGEINLVAQQRNRHAYYCGDCITQDQLRSFDTGFPRIEVAVCTIGHVWVCRYLSEKMVPVYTHTLMTYEPHRVALYCERCKSRLLCRIIWLDREPHKAMGDTDISPFGGIVSKCDCCDAIVASRWHSRIAPTEPDHTALWLEL